MVVLNDVDNRGWVLYLRPSPRDYNTMSVTRFQVLSHLDA